MEINLHIKLFVEIFDTLNMQDKIPQKRQLLLPYFLFLTLLVSANVHALSSLDSLVLGDISAQEEIVDPLRYVLTPIKHKDYGQSSQYLEQLYHLIGHYREGENLKQFCLASGNLNYGRPWQLNQAKRSVAATLQYLGLDLTTRAIAKYARHLKFSSSEYENLTNRLVGNYCSKNITVISLKQLRANLLAKFKSGTQLQLPSIRNNPLFPNSLVQDTESKLTREREMSLNVKLFRAFCSWNGEVDDFRLMSPLLKNHTIMALVSRQMGGKKISWDSNSKKLSIVPSSDTVKVSCNQLICRNQNQVDFLRGFPRSLGFNNISSDVNRLYCEHFIDLSEFGTPGQEKHIKEWSTTQNNIAQKVLIGHFIALLTGIPNFLVGQEKLNSMLEVLRSPIDLTWSKWAVYSNFRYSRDLTFEESLTIEVVDRKLYYDPRVPKFGVNIDVNLGELDRSNQMTDKIGISFNLKVARNTLRHMRTSWLRLDPSKPKKREAIIEHFKAQIEEQVQRARLKFIVPPWEGDLSRLIVLELLAQLEAFRGRYFEKTISNESIEIPIKFHFGNFALRYIHYRFRAERGQAEILLR